MKIKKILLFANHNNGHNISKYLFSRPDADIVKIVVYDDSPNQWWKSVKKLAKDKKLNTLIYKNNEHLFKKVKNLDIDLIISANWRHLLPAKLLGPPKIGAVNFHNSLLPKFRGAYASNWALEKGESASGVTLHWMAEKLDEGKIIFQEEVPIYQSDTARELWERTNKHFLSMFKKAWSQVDKWEKISQTQKGKSEYFSVKDFKNTNLLDLNKKVKIKDLINMLRARTFLPHYRNVYFIDQKAKKKIYISIQLTEEPS